MEPEAAFESNLGLCREFLAASVDARACGTVSSGGATIFTPCGDGLRSFLEALGL